MKVLRWKIMCGLAGISEILADSWKRRGIIRHPYNLQHVTGLAVAAWMRRQGIEFDHAVKVAGYLSRQRLGELEQKMADGYILLVLETVSGKLFLSKEDAVFRRHEFGEVQFVVLDLERIFARVKEQFEKFAYDDREIHACASR